MRRIVCLILLFSIARPLYGQGELSVRSGKTEVRWALSPEGWHVEWLGYNGIKWGTGDGSFTVLYTPGPLSDEPENVCNRDGSPVSFGIERFIYIEGDWNRAISSVPMNTAGSAYRFTPDTARDEQGSVTLSGRCDVGELKCRMWPDPDFPGDIRVEMTFTAAVEGYFSIPSVNFASIPEPELGWTVVPGFYQGNYIQPVFHLAYMYGQGLPHLPVVCNENTVTSPVVTMTAAGGPALSVIPEPGTGRTEFTTEGNRQSRVWRCGYSHMDRGGNLSPTLYSPVLGQENSYLPEGGTAVLSYRISMNAGDWYEARLHAVYDIYGFGGSLPLKETTLPLYKRMEAIRDYILDDSLSHWRTETLGGVTIGAQAYLGGVAGSDGDAMKNSDIGAAWMLAAMTGDPLLHRDRLPYMRNFKLLQQAPRGDRNYGAAMGQYYLAKKGTFTEEWGDHIEPTGITYYTITDLANILLFEPGDREVEEALRAGAEKLLSLQRADGSFPLAVDRTTGEPLFTDLEDLRPTFYGFAVAYEMLGDPRYLDAACKGADWFVRNATDRGAFTGVCGDARFINDFATAHAVQALLDMHRLTGEQRYLDAGIRTARIYTSSIYTMPVPTTDTVYYKGREMRHWQLSHAGLGFEHGGAAGSAVKSGPVLLSSHCGMFVNLYRETGDRYFLDLARASAIAREAHLDGNGIATYYWSQFDRGPGPFPHHAWWQLGWIADYLWAEAEMRSDGQIDMPRGFMTPKVGPQRPLGFAAGTIYGVESRPVMGRGLAVGSNPNVEILTALAADSTSLFVIAMNTKPVRVETSVEISGEVPGSLRVTTDAVTEPGSGDRQVDLSGISIDGYGIRIFRLPVTREEIGYNIGTANPDIDTGRRNNIKKNQ